MKQKLKIPLRAVAFLAGLTLLLLAGSRLVVPKSNLLGGGMHNARASGYLSEQEHTVDILFLGDSVTYSSVSPMQLWEQYGCTSYVCSTPGQYIEESYRYLVDFCERQSPSLVVLEAGPLFRSSGWYIDFGRATYLKAEKLFPIFRYHNRWKSLSLRDLTGKISYEWKNPLKGFVPSYEEQPWTGGNSYMNPTDTPRRVREFNRFYFDKIVRFCRDRDIELQVFSAPSPVNWNYAKHLATDRLTEEYGIPYMDMNLHLQDVKIDWAHDTRDSGDHLNINGAKKTTAYLGAYLNGLGLLTDRRSDPAYANWNADLTTYIQTISRYGGGETQPSATGS